MKKIFTLIAATVLTVATFAADRRPSVTLKSSRNYEIVIDGRSYFSNSGIMDLSNMRRGFHSIKVYEVNRRGGSPLGGLAGVLFGGRTSKRLVDASSFQLQNRDIDIIVDFRGQIRVTEDRYGRDRWDNNDRNSHDRGYQNQDPRDDRGGWDRH
ncbi:MAG TPA: hypothetical protein VFI06_13405 [Chitinophagaceae bacterium]|nr:hypothetical protein [Chitinophagaceae bacterium]